MKSSIAPLAALFTLIAALLSGCAAPLDVRCEPTSVHLPHPSTITPMPLVQGLPSVDVLINSRGPFRLIIDTGAEALFLSAAAARAAELPLTPVSAPFCLPDGTPDRVASIHLAHITTLEIADRGATNAADTPHAAFHDFHAVVRDIPGLADLAQANPRIDGILGTSILQHGTWTLSYVFQQLTIAPSTHAPPDARTTIPLFLIGPRRATYGLRAHIAGHPIDLLLDTGAADAISLPKPDIARLNAAPGGPFLEPTGHAARGGYFQHSTLTTYHLSAPVRFGDIEWHGRDVIEDTTASTFGSGALQHQQIVLDLAHQRIIFTASGCSPIPMR